MPGPRKRTRFDNDYYRRYYLHHGTRSVSEADVQDIADFVLSYAKRLQYPIGSVIDFGCGVGYWRTCIKRRRRAAVYLGVETSPFAIRRFGWTRGSVTDYRSGHTYDLVVCQSVLQYLGARDALRAIRTLACHARGLMYFEVVTREDWEQYCDQDMTDGSIYLRSADWYREKLSPYFVNAGGGVWLSRSSDAVLYALEHS